MMWYPPKNNGESITSYRLLGKSVGDDEFVELYYGPGTGFFLTDLVPEFGYSFIIHAYNSIGESPGQIVIFLYHDIVTYTYYKKIKNNNKIKNININIIFFKNTLTFSKQYVVC